MIGLSDVPNAFHFNPMPCWSNAMHSMHSDHTPAPTDSSASSKLGFDSFQQLLVAAEKRNRQAGATDLMGCVRFACRQCGTQHCPGYTPMKVHVSRKNSFAIAVRARAGARIQA